MLYWIQEQILPYVAKTPLKIALDHIHCYNTNPSIKNSAHNDDKLKIHSTAHIHYRKKSSNSNFLIIHSNFNPHSDYFRVSLHIAISMPHQF